MSFELTCDFCPDGRVDLMNGGRQEIVFSLAVFKAGTKEKATPRLKYRCKRCIENKITVTMNDLVIHFADELTKFDGDVR